MAGQRGSGSPLDYGLQQEGLQEMVVVGPLWLVDWGANPGGKGVDCRWW
jgi:hypothetical protein